MTAIRSGVLEPDGLGAGPGRDGELVGGLEALASQVGREDPGAVAAHLGDAAVGVAVVHEPPRPACACASTPRLGGQCRRDDPDDAVAADAGPAVGEPGGLLGGQLADALEVGHEDEVVLGPVPLGEGGLVSHGAPLSLIAARTTRHRLLGQVGGQRVEPGDPRVGIEPGLLAAGEAAGQGGRLVLRLARW